MQILWIASSPPVVLIVLDTVNSEPQGIGEGSQGWIDAEEDELLKHNTQDGTELRRARLAVQGTTYKDVFFKWNMDWAPSGGTRWGSRV